MRSSTHAGSSCALSTSPWETRGRRKRSEEKKDRDSRVWKEGNLLAHVRDLLSSGRENYGSSTSPRLSSFRQARERKRKCTREAMQCRYRKKKEAKVSACLLHSIRTIMLMNYCRAISVLIRTADSGPHFDASSRR